MYKAQAGALGLDERGWDTTRLLRWVGVGGGGGLGEAAENGWQLFLRSNGAASPGAAAVEGCRGYVLSEQWSSGATQTSIQFQMAAAPKRVLFAANQGLLGRHCREGDAQTCQYWSSGLSLRIGPAQCATQ